MHVLKAVNTWKLCGRYRIVIMYAETVIVYSNRKNQKKKEITMPIILWLLGVPLSLIIILWLLGVI
jgi:lipid-A-disaccharide synthase-like uncharacterized protein